MAALSNKELINTEAGAGLTAGQIKGQMSVFEDYPETVPEKPVVETVTKLKHGGNRSGAGRKRKYGGETCTIRIPKSAKQAVLDFLASQEWE